MKELETVVQDEKNKWILITGILQVLACVIMNKFDISNPNIIPVSYTHPTLPTILRV